MLQACKRRGPLVDKDLHAVLDQGTGGKILSLAHRQARLNAAAFVHGLRAARPEATAVGDVERARWLPFQQALLRSIATLLERRHGAQECLRIGVSRVEEETLI